MMTTDSLKRCSNCPPGVCMYLTGVANKYTTGWVGFSVIWFIMDCKHKIHTAGVDQKKMCVITLKDLKKCEMSFLVTPCLMHEIVRIAFCFAVRNLSLIHWILIVIVVNAVAITHGKFSHFYVIFFIIGFV